MSDHADELASWGLGDYAEGASQFDVPKYSYSSSPAQYEQVNKYSSLQPGPPGQPPPQIVYADKYKRLDENQVRLSD